MTKEIFNPIKIFGDTRATRRWQVVTMYEVAGDELSSRKIENPSNEDVFEFVSEAKKSPLYWEWFQKKVSESMRSELSKITGGFSKKDQPLEQSMVDLEKKVKEKYEKIDEDPKRNYSFLDPILFDQ